MPQLTSHNTLKTCNKCGLEKPHYKSERGNTCIDCKKESRRVRYAKQKEQEREYHLQKKYNISQEVYEHMYSLQGGACKICEKNFPRLHVDHDHKTGNVRGLLCGSCNRAIGLLKDDVSNLTNAINYINNARSKGDAD